MADQGLGFPIGSSWGYGVGSADSMLYRPLSPWASQQASSTIWNWWLFGTLHYQLYLNGPIFSTTIEPLAFVGNNYNLLASAVIFDRVVALVAADDAIRVPAVTYAHAIEPITLSYVPAAGVVFPVSAVIYAHAAGNTTFTYVPAGTIAGAACSYDFSNYPAFRRALQQLIDGDDVSPSNISPQTLDLFVAMGERRVYRDVRSSAQDALMTLTVTGNSAPLPIDCIELRSVYFPTRVPLRYMAYEQLQARLQIEQQVSSKPVWYSFEGDNLIFYPTQADGTVILGRYYKRFCSIVTEGLTGNTYFERYPDLWLYAALMESAPFIGEVTRLPQWQQTYLSIAEAAGEYETRRYTRGSKLQTRVA